MKVGGECGGSVEKEKKKIGGERKKKEKELFNII